MSLGPAGSSLGRGKTARLRLRGPRAVGHEVLPSAER